MKSINKILLVVALLLAEVQILILASELQRTQTALGQAIEVLAQIVAFLSGAN